MNFVNTRLFPHPVIPHQKMDLTAQFLTLPRDDVSLMSDSCRANPESDLLNQNAN